jgi:hypothetical protein
MGLTAGPGAIVVAGGSGGGFMFSHGLASLRRGAGGSLGAIVAFGLLTRMVGELLGRGDGDCASAEGWRGARTAASAPVVKAVVRRIVNFILRMCCRRSVNGNVILDWEVWHSTSVIGIYALFL